MTDMLTKFSKSRWCDGKSERKSTWRSLKMDWHTRIVRPKVWAKSQYCDNLIKPVLQDTLKSQGFQCWILAAAKVSFRKPGLLWTELRLSVNITIGIIVACKLFATGKLDVQKIFLVTLNHQNYFFRRFTKSLYFICHESSRNIDIGWEKGSTLVFNVVELEKERNNTKICYILCYKINGLMVPSECYVLLHSSVL